MSVAPEQPAHEPTSFSAGELRLLADRGIALCRQGEWQRGLEVLAAVAETDHREGDLPGHFHSYLGYALARCGDNIPLGLTLARHGAEKHFFDPDNFLNLARIYLLAGRRRKAYRSILKGLRIDSGHVALRRLLSRLGRRRRPIVSFLSRGNPVNRALGLVRHHLRH